MEFQDYSVLMAVMLAVSTISVLIGHAFGYSRRGDVDARRERAVRAATWREGYDQGILDERTAAGWDYPALPDRQNPYDGDKNV